MKMTVTLNYDGRDADHHRITQATKKFLLNKNNVETIICTSEDVDYIMKMRDDSLEKIKKTRTEAMWKFCKDVLCKNDSYFGTKLKVSDDANHGELILLGVGEQKED